tara:strand:+ start:74 stop:334 length:261 start_codon:yes stop_codon:yes gene_type:complete
MIDTSGWDGQGVELHKHNCGAAVNEAKKQGCVTDVHFMITLPDFEAPEGVAGGELEELAFADWNSDLLAEGSEGWPVRIMPCAGGK